MLATVLQTTTEITGLAAYTLAMLACGLAVWQTHGVERRWWIGLLAWVAMLTLDLLLNLRFILGDALGAISQRGGWYGDRTPVQIIFHVACGLWCVMMGVVLPIWARCFGWPLRLALIGGVLAATVLLAEVVSLGSVDRFLHADISGVMLVALVWVAAGGMMAGGAVGRIRRK